MNTDEAQCDSGLGDHMSKTEKILAASPYVEAAVRRLYWGSPVLPEMLAFVKTQKAKRAKEKKKAPAPSVSMDTILQQLREWGVKKGDLLLLHSSYRSIRGGGLSPDAVIDAFLDYLGPEGTLCMPSIPYWPEAPKLYERLTADYDDIVLDYDPETTPAWTGAVASAMIKRKEAVRSLHPLNSMTAIGPLAEDMVKTDLDGDRPRPNGPQSSWNFCLQHNAWVLAAGADMAHSLTMIHTAEDLLGDDWPVKNWYRDRRFNIKINGVYEEKTVRERHPVWASYYGERTLSKDLIEAGVCRRATPDGVNLELLRSRDLIDFLNLRNDTLYPYFMIPPSKQKPRKRSVSTPTTKKMVLLGEQQGRAFAQFGDRFLLEHNGEWRTVDADRLDVPVCRMPVVTDTLRARRRHRLVDRVLRAEARAAFALDADRFLVSCREGIRGVNLANATAPVEWSEPGRNPFDFASCEGVAGFDDAVLYGEYGSNDHKRPFSVWARTHDGQHKRVFTFADGAINHIHALVPDAAAECVWILTGDYGDGAGIWRATDNFAEVEPVLRGTQDARTCRVFPVDGGLVYATDTHLAPNSIRHLHRGADGAWVSERILPTKGSCIYAAQVGGQMVFTTSVEPGRPTGNKMLDLLDPRRGPGIASRDCQIYVGNLDDGFALQDEWRSDLLPKRLFGFSTIATPSRQGDSVVLALTGVGIAGKDRRTLFFKLHD